MSTIEQTIVDQVIARMKTIQVGASVTAAGRLHQYATTVKGAYDGREVPFNVIELPAVNVLTVQSEATGTGAHHHDHELQLVLVLHMADNAPSAAIRRFIADTLACIGADETLGVPEVLSLEDPAYTKKIVAAGNFIGSAHVGIAVNYRSLRWQL